MSNNQIAPNLNLPTSAAASLDYASSVPRSAPEQRALSKTPENRQSVTVSENTLTKEQMLAISAQAKKDGTKFSPRIEVKPLGDGSKVNEKIVIHLSGEKGEKIDHYFRQINSTDGRDLYRVVDSNGNVVGQFRVKPGAKEHSHISIDFKENGKYTVEGPFHAAGVAAGAGKNDDVIIKQDILVQNFSTRTPPK